MNYTALKIADKKEVLLLVYESFKRSDGIEEAEAVTQLVEKFLQSYPRPELKGFVAKRDQEILGCVFFSRLIFPESDKEVFLLSPMAVKTSLQGRGIGQGLLTFAHDQLKASGVALTVTYGDVNFYGKLGYELISTRVISAPFPLSYPEVWLGFSLDGVSELRVDGPCSCIPELRNPQLW